MPVGAPMGLPFHTTSNSSEVVLSPSANICSRNVFGQKKFTFEAIATLHLWELQPPES